MEKKIIRITTFDKSECEEIDANENKYSEKISPKEIMAEEERECMEQVFIGRAFLLYPELEQQDDDMSIFFILISLLFHIDLFMCLCFRSISYFIDFNKCFECFQS